MCGFGGFINHKDQLNIHQVAEIAKNVNFRGPDSCGIRIFDHHLKTSDSGHTGVFFNRLAIIDIDSRSDQPFEDDRHLLMFNGEIYNYLEIKKELQKNGTIFKTASDTEVLFYALKSWGKEALKKLNGMFAFFWLDKIEGSYTIGRDRLGIKPLYYCFNRESFYFSSELHSILRMLKTVPPVSQASIDMYLWMQFVPTPHTILEGISKLPPGTTLSGSCRRQSLSGPKAYWDCYTFVNKSSGRSSPEDLELMLKDSVHRQLQADVPIGLFLSSGVDSSLLASIVNKYFGKDQDVNFFTVSFGETTATDESHDAAAFIQGFGNPHLINHTLSIDPKFMHDQINTLYTYYDEPFGDYASLLNWAISKKARDFVTVALSGDGADELFWGYSRYDKWQRLKRINAVPLLSKAITESAGLIPINNIKNKIRKTFVHGPIERHFDQFLLPAFRSYFKKPITCFDMWATENVGSVSGRSDLPSILDIKTYLSDAMLYKVDRSSMATSLEVRVPYLDNEVLEYALLLDISYKSNGLFKHKAILKNLLLTLAPHYDANRPKKGFSFPLKKWLMNNWKEQVISSVTPRALHDLGLPSRPFINIISNFYEKKMNCEVEVWYLFNLVLWKQSMNNFRHQ